VFGIARTTGRQRDPGRDRQDERVGLQRGEALLEGCGDVTRLHRHDHDVRFGHRPSRTRGHAYTGEPLLEQAASLGIDLGHGQRVGVPPRLEQAAEQRLAHAAAAE
jgi:hypothetical protein